MAIADSFGCWLIVLHCIFGRYLIFCSIFVGYTVVLYHLGRYVLRSRQALCNSRMVAGLRTTEDRACVLTTRQNTPTRMYGMCGLSSFQNFHRLVKDTGWNIYVIGPRCKQWCDIPNSKVLIRFTLKKSPNQNHAYNNRSHSGLGHIVISEAICKWYHTIAITWAMIIISNRKNNLIASYPKMQFLLTLFFTRNQFEA